MFSKRRVKIFLVIFPENGTWHFICIVSFEDWIHLVNFLPYQKWEDLIVLGFNGMSTLVGHTVSSPREREKRDRRESRGEMKEREREERGI